MYTNSIIFTAYHKFIILLAGYVISILRTTSQARAGSCQKNTRKELRNFKKLTFTCESYINGLDECGWRCG